MNFKALATVALIGAASIIGGGEANAETCFQVQRSGCYLCNTYRGSTSAGDNYTLGYSINGISEGMTVTCRGTRVVDWSSYGDMTQLGAERLADYFCALP